MNTQPQVTYVSMINYQIIVNKLDLIDLFFGRDLMPLFIQFNYLIILLS